MARPSPVLGPCHCSLIIFCLSTSQLLSFFRSFTSSSSFHLTPPQPSHPSLLFVIADWPYCDCLFLY